jgi:hypothetical protein
VFWLEQRPRRPNVRGQPGKPGAPSACRDIAGTLPAQPGAHRTPDRGRRKKLQSRTTWNPPAPACCPISTPSSRPRRPGYPVHRREPRVVAAPADPYLGGHPAGSLGRPSPRPDGARLAASSGAPAQSPSAPSPTRDGRRIMDRRPHPTDSRALGTAQHLDPERPLQQLRRRVPPPTASPTPTTVRNPQPRAPPLRLCLRKLVGRWRRSWRRGPGRKAGGSCCRRSRVVRGRCWDHLLPRSPPCSPPSARCERSLRSGY